MTAPEHIPADYAAATLQRYQAEHARRLAAETDRDAAESRAAATMQRFADERERRREAEAAWATSAGELVEARAQVAALAEELRGVRAQMVRASRLLVIIRNGAQLCASDPNNYYGPEFQSLYDLAADAIATLDRDAGNTAASDKMADQAETKDDPVLVGQSSTTA